MNRKVIIFLVMLSMLACIVLMGCDTSSNNDGGNDIVYEEKFLGKWSNSDALFSFQYKNGVYCGGAVSSELSTVVFTKYTATKSTVTIYMEDGRKETFIYEFSGDYLYLDDIKLKKFN